MKTIISFISLFQISLLVFSQNPFKYESKTITINSTKSNDGFNGERISSTTSVGGFTIQGGSTFNQKAVAFDINGSIRSAPNTTIHQVLEFIHKNLNDNGYSLKSAVGNVDIAGTGSVTLFFEKSNSYREAELYKLINELNTRIDATSKKYTDSAMVEIQTSVLNYLKSIPNEVITQAYKEELTKIILSEAEDKLIKVVEELKKEIRNSSIGNN
jgi:hypothetical protein